MYTHSNTVHSNRFLTTLTDNTGTRRHPISLKLEWLCVRLCVHVNLALKPCIQSAPALLHESQLLKGCCLFHLYLTSSRILERNVACVGIQQFSGVLCDRNKTKVSMLTAIKAHPSHQSCYTLSNTYKLKQVAQLQCYRVNLAETQCNSLASSSCWLTYLAKSSLRGIAWSPIFEQFHHLNMWQTYCL